MVLKLINLFQRLWRCAVAIHYTLWDSVRLIVKSGRLGCQVGCCATTIDPAAYIKAGSSYKFLIAAYFPYISNITSNFNFVETCSGGVLLHFHFLTFHCHFLFWWCRIWHTGSHDTDEIMFIMDVWYLKSDCICLGKIAFIFPLLQLPRSPSTQMNTGVYVTQLVLMKIETCCCS